MSTTEINIRANMEEIKERATADGEAQVQAIVTEFVELELQKVLSTASHAGQVIAEIVLNVSGVRLDRLGRFPSCKELKTAIETLSTKYEFTITGFENVCYGDFTSNRPGFFATLKW